MNGVALVTDWKLSSHAVERMAERAIAPSELVRLLEAPARETPSDMIDGRSILWNDDIGAVVNVPEKIVITVLIHQSDADSWEEDAVLRVQDRGPGMTMDELEALLLQHEKPTYGKRWQTKPPSRDGKVTTSNVLDQVLPALRAEILRQCDGDLRRVRIVGKNNVEILPATHVPEQF